MEFTEIFNAFAILLCGVLFIGGLITVYNTEYSENVGNTGVFSNSITNIELNLTEGFVNRGLTYANSTTPAEGQGTSTDQSDNILKRAWNTITNIRQLIGLVPALMNEGAAAINIPQIYTSIAKALFWTIFSITLAYLLILGGRRLL